MKFHLSLAVAAALFLSSSALAQDAKSTADQAGREGKSQMPMDNMRMDKMPMGKMPMGKMMDQCSEHCQTTADSIEKTSKLIEDAKSSNDPQKMREALDQTQEQLEKMDKHMSGCSQMMSKMHKMHDGMMMGGGNQ